MPANDLKELIVWLKANPNKASQATPVSEAVACRRRLLPEGNRHAISVRTLPRHRPGYARLVAGHIDLMIDGAADSVPQVRTGTIKAYAVAAKHRLATAPDIPTVDEAACQGSIFHLACAVGAQGDAKGHRCKTQRRSRGSLSRSWVRNGWPTSGRKFPYGISRRRRHSRITEGRNQEMVADHQGRQHQERNDPPVASISGGAHDETSPPSISASGRGRCRAPGRVADRVGANLSDAAGALDHRPLRLAAEPTSSRV